MKLRFLLLSTVLCLVCSIQVGAQISSGVIVGGGIGALDTKYKKLIPATGLGSVYESSYNYDLYVGYRFRIQQPNLPFFYDLDARFGTMSITETSFQGQQAHVIKEKELGNNQKYYFALGAMANVHIYKGLNLGVGVEPTYYFVHQHNNKVSPRFDIPVVAKIGYDFGPFELALSGKLGLFRNSKKGVLDSNRREALMLSVYIPLFR